jgi:hypothetical protein
MLLMILLRKAECAETKNSFVVYLFIEELKSG